jgi:hypothetical protein
MIIATNLVCGWIRRRKQHDRSHKVLLHDISQPVITVTAVNTTGPVLATEKDLTQKGEGHTVIWCGHKARLSIQQTHEY